MFTLYRVIKGVRSLLIGPTHLRRRTIHELARLSASFLGGHYIGDDYKLWLKEKDFIKQFRALSPHNYFSMERKFALKEFARSVVDLPGMAAECGSYTGASAWFIANELQETDIYLFDSFEGLPTPGRQDASPPGVQQWQAADFAVSEDLILKNLSAFNNVRIMKGWIPERFPEVADKRFKLVHIDVDLYQPTLDSLIFFYERLVPGGIIVMDDYGFENCPGAYSAANEFMETRPENIIHLPTGQGIIIRGCQ